MGLLYLLYDPTYLLVIIGVLITVISSLTLEILFWIYDRKYVLGNETANDVCNKILRNAGINDICIGHVRGQLTDHYNPLTKELNLSDSTYRRASISAVGVAAHECGHAIQHAENFVLLKLRMLSVPVARIGSWLSWPLILIGLFIERSSRYYVETGTSGVSEGQLLINLGIYLFLGVLAFQLITLPVEIDASRRAVKVLKENWIMDDEELRGVRIILFAAAMTYVASIANSILTFLRLLLRTGLLNIRRRR